MVYCYIIYPYDYYSTIIDGTLLTMFYFLFSDDCYNFIMKFPFFIFYGSLFGLLFRLASFEAYKSNFYIFYMGMLDPFLLGELMLII
jgi:hypothetical protein